MENKNIYSTVPGEALDGEGNKNSLRKYFNENKGLFKTARKIALETGYKPTGTQVQLRKAITELIEEEQMPIVSNDKGFALASTPEQIKHYIQSLEERKQGIQRRIDSLKILLGSGKQKKNNDQRVLCCNCGKVAEGTKVLYRSYCNDCKRGIFG